MKVFICKSQATDKKFCYVSRHISALSSPLARGLPLTPLMEEYGESRVDLTLDEDRGGLELPDLVGNRLNYLILRNTVASALAKKFDFGPCEQAPVALINKKKRVHSADYVVVNPQGQLDVLDPERTELDGSGELFVKIFGKWALKPDAIPTDRDIFRVKGLPAGYFFSERIVDFIRGQKYTNVELTDVTV